MSHCAEWQVHNSHKLTRIDHSPYTTSLFRSTRHQPFLVDDLEDIYSKLFVHEYSLNYIYPEKVDTNTVGASLLFLIKRFLFISQGRLNS